MPETDRKRETDYFRAIKLDEIDGTLAGKIREDCGVDIELCLECGKCSGGCASGNIFDFTPRKIMQLIKLGEMNRLIRIDALWTCVSCQLCWDRCPSGIDIARIIDYMREMAWQKGVMPTRRNVLLFHELMLDLVKKTGRVDETRLALMFNLKSGQYTKDADLGRKLFFKGKISPFSTTVNKIDEVQRIFKFTEAKKGEPE